MIMLCLMMDASGFVSTHFVKSSIDKTRKLTFFRASGNGLTISMYYYEKGHGLIRLIIDVAVIIGNGVFLAFSHLYVMC